MTPSLHTNPRDSYLTPLYRVSLALQPKFTPLFPPEHSHAAHRRKTTIVRRAAAGGRLWACPQTSSADHCRGALSRKGGEPQ